jgi:hypothetical protein
MLVAAVLVPDTALLVPGAAGRSDVAREVRADVLQSLRAALEDASAVVVVAPADERRGTEHPVELVGTVTASLAAAGVPDSLLPAVPVLDLPGPSRGTERPVVPLVTRPPSVASVVALHLLDAVGRRSGVRVVEVPRPGAAPASDEPRVWTELGRDLVSGDAPVVLVVVGSGSGRHGPGAPIAEDPDALEADGLLVGALTHADVATLVGGLTARRAARLAVSGWRPWQVLAGAVAAVSPGIEGTPRDAATRTPVALTGTERDVVAEGRTDLATRPAPGLVADVTAPVLLGAQHVVGTWRVTA